MEEQTDVDRVGRRGGYVYCFAGALPFVMRALRGPLLTVGATLRILYWLPLSLTIRRLSAFEDLTGYPAESGATVDLSEIGTDEGEGFLVRIGVDCDDRGRLCARWFWAYEGDALVSSIDWANPVGSTFSGSLTDVLFREATLDENELPILVPDGCSFTMESFAWDYAVTLASGDGK